MKLKLKFAAIVIAMLCVIAAGIFGLSALLQTVRYNQFIESCLRTHSTDVTYCKQMGQKIFE